MASDFDAGACDDHFSERDAHVDAAPDEARFDRVVAGVHPHVVVAGQTHAEAQRQLVNWPLKSATDSKLRPGKKLVSK